MSTENLTHVLDTLQLIDHHVHGVLTDTPEDLDFCSMLTESHAPAHSVTHGFHNPLGLAIRRWCAPLLDLPTFCQAQTYLDRRRDLGNDVVSRIFLTSAGVHTFLVDTGHAAERISSPQQLATRAGAYSLEILRLESLLEEVAGSGISAARFAQEFQRRLAQAVPTVIGLKSIVAYRYGLDFDPARPGMTEVAAAASHWFAEIAKSGTTRVTDPVLLRFAIWSGIDTGLPLQIHVGFGDPDLHLRRADPLALTQFLDATRGSGAKIMLLHCYPFHREAAYLAHAYPSVYIDIGLAINFLGTSARTIVAESMELTPFDKLLYSSDAWGPAELHYLGARLWRTATGEALGSWVDRGDCSPQDAVDIAIAIGQRNAVDAYGLGDSQ